MANRFTRAAKALFATTVAPLEQPAKELPLDNVTTYERAEITLGSRFNPDTLTGRHGLGIYDKMRLDEQVKAVMNFKRDAITARGWTFKYDESSSLPDKERKRRIRIFTEILNKMKGSFLDGLNLIATGRDYGFSMTEKVLSQVSIDGEQFIGLNMLLLRRPNTFEFFCDEYGLLRRVEQVVPMRRLQVDMSRMIHYVHSPEFDLYYGRSDLREAYRAWYCKQRTIEFWMLFMERLAGGFVVANRTEASSLVYGSAEYLSLQEVLKNLHSTSGIIPPPGVEIEMMFPATTDAYEKAIVFWDLAIAKSLLVPNLLGISHTGQTGAFSQSQTQLEAFFWTLNADSLRLEACVNEQLIKDIGFQNFGDGEYPSFGFKPASIEHIKVIIEQWKQLSDAKSVIATEADEEHFRKLLDMPKREPGAKPLIEPALPAEEKPPTEKPPAEKPAANDDKIAAIRSELHDIQAKIAGFSRADPQGHPLAIPHGDLRGATRAQFNRASMRVAFSVIQNRQDRMADDLTGQLSGFVAKAAKKLLGSDADLLKLIDEDPADIADVELTGNQKAKLKEIFRRSLASAWTLGGSLARNEIERARGQRLVRMRDLRDVASDYFEANGFRMAGNVADGVRALIQQELQNSIKFGRTAKATREVIWDRLVSRGFTSRAAVRDSEDDPAVMQALNDLWGASEARTASYLDTLARTNLFEAMNEARFAEFTDPELGSFVQALAYSAILDDRTTEICQALHDKVYKEDSEVWDEFRPPNHYNCRSVLIPITELDGWDGRESPPPSVQPQAGFGGTLQ